MTVIAAFDCENKYWIASDSVGSAVTMKYEIGSKLIKKGNYVIGFSWSYRVADIIKECTDLPLKIKGMKDLRILRDKIKEKIIQDELVGKNENTNCNTYSYGKPDGHPLDLIIIAPSGMYTIESDYQIHKIPDGYIACGSGTEVAMGVLYSCKEIGIEGKSAVKLAVKAAIKHIITCGGKCHIQSVEKTNGKR